MATVTIATRSGPKDIEAFASETTGLVVHRGVAPASPRDKWWTVTHTSSGLAIAHFATKRSALDFADELEGLADWTGQRESFRGDLAHRVGALLAFADRRVLLKSVDAPSAQP